MRVGRVTLEFGMYVGRVHVEVGQIRSSAGRILGRLFVDWAQTWSKSQANRVSIDCEAWVGFRSPFLRRVQLEDGQKIVSQLCKIRAETVR